MTTTTDALPRPGPSPIALHRALLASFLRAAHKLTVLVLSHLDTHLRLAPNTLASLHPLDRPSGTSLRLLRYLPHPPEDRRTSLLGHTDIGSVTVLFSVLGGLQILPLSPPGSSTESRNEAAAARNGDTSTYSSNDWRYVRPEPGYAIVNLGDAMVEWSDGLLHSDLHRVTHPPGRQADSVRYSIAYLARPEGTVLMRPLQGDSGSGIVPTRKGEVSDEEDGKGKVWTALEWERRKSEAIVAGRDVARKGERVEERRIGGM
jgi:isopenicillin N synthase-like dioxygenase